MRAVKRIFLYGNMIHGGSAIVMVSSEWAAYLELVTLMGSTMSDYNGMFLLKYTQDGGLNGIILADFFLIVGATASTVGFGKLIPQRDATSSSDISSVEAMSKIEIFA